MEINNLLIVDDDELNKLILDPVLSEAEAIRNYNIQQSGWDALEYLESCQKVNDFPDCIFVDLNMPEMSGFEFIERYEKLFHEKFKETKVVVVTNSILKDDINRSFQFKSVTDYKNKPLTVEKIMEIVNKYSTVNGKAII